MKMQTDLTVVGTVLSLLQIVSKPPEELHTWTHFDMVKGHISNFSLMGFSI